LIIHDWTAQLTAPPARITAGCGQLKKVNRIFRVFFENHMTFFLKLRMVVFLKRMAVILKRMAVILKPMVVILTWCHFETNCDCH